MTREERRVPIAVFAAVACSAAVVFSFFAGRSAAAVLSTFAIISFPGATEDREVVSRLRAAGFDEIASESTQWVLVDDFGEAERVPLDRYDERIEAFDPRNDGYADRLRGLFVAGDRRYAYLKRPYAVLSAGDAAFRRSLEAALRGIDFRLEAEGSGRSLLAPLVGAIGALLAAAAIGKNLPRFVAGAPVLLAVSAYGPGGLAVAGFLAVSYSCLSSFFAEAVRDRRMPGSESDPMPWAKSAVARFRLRALGGPPWLSDPLLPALASAACALAAAILGSIPIPFLLAASAALASVSFAHAAVDRRFSNRSGRYRFSPVSLRPKAFDSLPRLSRSIAPFAFAAVLVLAADLLGFARESQAPTGLADPAMPIPDLTLEDYRDHLKAQNAFMTTRLTDSVDGVVDAGYPSFLLDASGRLAAGDSEARASASYRVESPPVERFLTETGFGPLSDEPVRRVPPGALAAILAALAATIPSFVSLERGRRLAKGAAALGDKRIAA